MCTMLLRFVSLSPSHKGGEKQPIFVGAKQNNTTKPMHPVRISIEGIRSRSPDWHSVLLS